MSKAKVQWNGRAQTVRLPRDCHFSPDTREVNVRRQGDSLVLEPLRQRRWPDRFWRAFGELPADFERPAQVPQVRESLDL